MSVSLPIPRWWRGVVIVCWGLALLGNPTRAAAHFGEPYGVLLDQPIGPYTVTAYADPDVGTGTFYVDVAMPGAVVPPDTSVIINAVPEDKHPSPALVVVKGTPKDGLMRYEGDVDFDAEGYWTIRMQVAGSAGAGDITFRILVTPPYPQWVTTLQCLAPFGVIGVLWLLAMKRNAMLKRQAAQAITVAAATSVDPIAHEQSP